MGKRHDIALRSLSPLFALGFPLLLFMIVSQALFMTAAAAAPDERIATAEQQLLYRGTKIIGSNVRDPDNRKIGVIKDLMLDSRRGEIAYAVLSFGGVMGVGEKYHAIPWAALSPSDDGRFYVLRADEKTIAGAPGFDKSKWPDMEDRKWSVEIDHYWRSMVGTGAAWSNRLGAPGVSAPSETSSGR